MTRRRIWAFSICAFCSLAAAQGQAPKKRVAVFDFEYGTVKSSIAGIFGTDVDVGKGIADLLVQQLVKDGTYTVVERKALEKVIAEQNFSNSDRADADTAAKIGRVLGVDGIILGSITQFGRDDKNVGVSGGAVGGALGRFGIGRVQRNEAKAAVGVTARMIDTSTAAILLAVTGTGQSTRSGVGLLGTGGSSGGTGAAATDMTSANFSQTLLGEATAQAVEQTAKQLDAGANTLPHTTVAIEGLVADITGDTVTLNVGSKAGVQKGESLNITRKVREIKDPATGRVIRTVEDKLGTVTITEVDELFSVGKYTGQPIKVGDQVSNSQ